MYSSYGIQTDDPFSYDQRNVSFAKGSNNVTVEIDQTKLYGYEVVGCCVDPLTVLYRCTIVELDVATYIYIYIYFCMHADFIL